MFKNYTLRFEMEWRAKRTLHAEVQGLQPRFGMK